jgi:GST-like protein
MSTPIDLYFWPTPNGRKISIMLEECELPYTVKRVNIGAGEQFHPDFVSVAPTSRIPAIVDHDGPGGKPVSIFESGAILQYLGRKTGKFYPKAERARIEVEQWLFFQVGHIGPMGGQAHHFRRFAKEKVPYAIERYTKEMARLYGIMNTRLSESPYLAGRYSIADIACFGWASYWEWQGQDLKEFPHLEAWLARVSERPAVQRGSKV